MSVYTGLQHLVASLNDFITHFSTNELMDNTAPFSSKINWKTKNYPAAEIANKPIANVQNFMQDEDRPQARDRGSNRGKKPRRNNQRPSSPGQKQDKAGKPRSKSPVKRVPPEVFKKLKKEFISDPSLAKKHSIAEYVELKRKEYNAQKKQNNPKQ